MTTPVRPLEYLYHTRPEPVRLMRHGDQDFITIPANMLFPAIGMRRAFRPLFNLAPPFWEMLHRDKPKRILLYRTGAMGDLVMMVPALKTLEHHCPWLERIVIQCHWGHIGIFDHWPLIQQVRLEERAPYDLAIYLNVASDVDVYYRDYWKVHRVDLAFDSMGIPQDVRRYDYALPTCGPSDPALLNAITDGPPIVGIQYRGSVTEKTLAPKYLQALAVMLRERGLRPAILSTEPAQVEWPPGTLQVVKPKLHDLIAFVRRCYFIVSMDSGIQVLSHVVRRPLLNLISMSAPDVRLSHHPLSVAVQLDKMIGCKPCYTRRYYCQMGAWCMRPVMEGYTPAVTAALDWLVQAIPAWSAGEPLPAAPTAPFLSVHANQDLTW